MIDGVFSIPVHSTNSVAVYFPRKQNAIAALLASYSVLIQKRILKHTASCQRNTYLVWLNVAAPTENLIWKSRFFTNL